MQAENQPSNSGFFWVPDKEAAKAETYSKGYTDASQRGFYQTQYWRDFREYKLQIEPTCKICEGNGKTVEAKTVDHIEPIPKNCTFEKFVELTKISTTQSLCRKCHEKKTALDRHGKKVITQADIKKNMSRFEE